MQLCVYVTHLLSHLAVAGVLQAGPLTQASVLALQPQHRHVYTRTHTHSIQAGQLSDINTKDKKYFSFTRVSVTFLRARY